MRTPTLILLGLMFATVAQATTHRTFVAASGTDGGPCGPTTPCRSLEYALSQTNDGGEIIITQSGGYGNATGGLVIDKSVSIIAEPGVFAALAPTTGNGITIATAGIKVVIKGLTINGRGGTVGINMTDGTSLLVEKTTIANFPAYGMDVQTAAAVNVVDSVVRDNYYGIQAGAGATIGISGSKLLNHTEPGIWVRTTGTATGVTTTFNINDTVVSGANNCVYNTEISGNTGVVNANRVTATRCGNGFYNFPAGGGSMTVRDSTASNNSTFGFASETGTLTVTGSTASNNEIGFYHHGGILIVSGSTASNNTVYGFYRIGVTGAFVSLGNNTVYGNSTDVGGTITPAALQ